MSVGPSGGVGSKSPIKIFANIFISFIGAGVLGLPFAFKEAGILEGTVIMSAVGLVSVKAMLLLIDCRYRLVQKDTNNAGNSKSSPVSGPKIIIKEKEGSKEEKEDLIAMEINGSVSQQIEEPTKPAAPGQELTYGDVGYYAIGNTGRFMVDAAIIVSQIGFCCAYLIFISENLADYIDGLHLIHWLGILLPPLALLTLLRHLSSLAISSLFAQLSNLLAFAVVFWFDFEHFSQIDIHPKEMSLKGFPFFLAVSMYCYEGAGLILSLESSVAGEIRPFFKRYFKTTLMIVTMLYITFGICGYLSFGAETNAIITLNLPKGFGLDFAMVVKSCLCLALFFTYPVMMFPVVQLLEKTFVPKPDENIWKGNCLRFVMVFVTGLVVLAVPNFANLMALIGSTCCTLLAFIMPGLFHLKIFKGSLTKSQVFLDVFLIVMGVIGTIVGTWDTMVRLRETHTGVAAVESEIVMNLTSSNINDTASQLVQMMLRNTVTPVTQPVNNITGPH